MKKKIPFMPLEPRKKTVLRNNLMPSSVSVDEVEFESFSTGMVDNETNFEDTLEAQDAPTRGYYQHGCRPYRPSRLT
jgi:hypothetical protein